MPEVSFAHNAKARHFMVACCNSRNHDSEVANDGL